MISHCPICGFPFADPISETDLRQSFTICDCCGCEYGYDDTVEFRRKWLEDGARWFNIDVKPVAWDVNEQLKHSLPSWNDHSQNGSSLNPENPETEVTTPTD